MTLNFLMVFKTYIVFYELNMASVNKSLMLYLYTRFKKSKTAYVLFCKNALAFKKNVSRCNLGYA